jgi:hypothetical protein
LKLVPRFTSRPVVAYYLDKLGREVPPLPAAEAPSRASPTTPPVEPLALPENVFAPGPLRTGPEP